MTVKELSKRLESFLLNVRLLVICTDARGWQHPTTAQIRGLAGARQLLLEKVSFEPRDDCASVVELNRLLETQFMGTRFYICGRPDTVQFIQQSMESSGITEEEMMVQLIDVPEKHVFCIGCYERFSTAAALQEVECPSCRRTVVVSNHYSRKLDAVMGYLTISR